MSKKGYDLGSGNEFNQKCAGRRGGVSTDRGARRRAYNCSSPTNQQENSWIAQSVAS